MATTHIDLRQHPISSFRHAPTDLEIDDFADLDAPAVVDAGHARRRRAVKVAGATCIVGLCAISAWMATSTPAGDAIASWSTMGNVVQLPLATPSLDVADPAERELTLTTSTMEWAAGPAPAELERPAAVDEPPVPVPVHAVADPGPAREGDADDPYAAVRSPARPAPATPGVVEDREVERTRTPDIMNESPTE